MKKRREKGEKKEKDLKRREFDKEREREREVNSINARRTVGCLVS